MNTWHSTIAAYVPQLQFTGRSCVILTCPWRHLHVSPALCFGQNYKWSKGDNHIKKKQISEKKISQSQTSNKDLNQRRLEADTTPLSSLSRREFLGNVGGVTAVTLITGAGGLPSFIDSAKTADKQKQQETCDIGSIKGDKRINQAFQFVFGQRSLRKIFLFLSTHVTAMRSCIRTKSPAIQRDCHIITSARLTQMPIML